MAPEFGSLYFKAVSFFGTAGSAEEVGMGGPSARKTRCIPEIVLQVGFPGDQFVSSCW